MPVEIRELVVKAIITPDLPSSSEDREQEQRLLVDMAVAQVLRALELSKEP